ncbi:MAG: ParB N-terminal domain-containing protein [Pseudorhodoplanes sp.]|nr:ParB N-terminal domain-containing protein [Pseudorhodoplanes sp.]
MPPDELSVEQWPIERLLPYVANARTHPDEQIAQIAGSIAEFGFNVPCLVDERSVLIAGHGRLIAAKRLGLSDVPVIRLAHLTDAQARAFRLADNRIALNAGWDEALLAAELGRLKEDGVDLELLGFGEDELDRLLDGLDGEAGADGEDDVPEPPTEAVTKPGDLWLLGAHRLLCGDATVTTHVERLLGGKRPHLMVTDPPYGVEYDPNWRNEAGISATARTGKVSNDDRADWREAWSLFPGDAAYVWHSGVRSRTVAESLEACDFKVRAQIIWAKPRLVLGRGDYHWQHEPCFYAVRNDAHWQGARDQTTLWTIGAGAEEDEATVHGTQKPVECMRRPMINNSTRGDLIYEPFAGSGSTLIAAESIVRVCVAMELDPRYCDVIIERFQRHTGIAATLAGSDRTFETLRAERIAA